MKQGVVFFILFIAALRLSAYDLYFCNKILYQSVCSQDMSLWENEIKNDIPYTFNDKVHHTYMLYFLVAHLVEQKQDEKAECYIEHTFKYIESFDCSKYFVEIEILKNGLLFFKASISPFSAVYYLSEVSSAIQNLKSKNSESPYYLIEMANYYFHLPHLLGGDYLKAIDLYKRGIDHFEKSNSDLSCNWYYLNAHIWLAKAYENINNKQMAINVYDKIIKKAPQFIAVSRWKNKLISENSPVKQ